VLIPWVMGDWTILTALGMFLAFWVGGSVVLSIVKRLRVGRPPIGWWAMQLGHFGIAVFVVGVTMVGGYQQEKDVRMEPGDTTSVGGYDFRFLGVKEVRGPNYTAFAGDFELLQGGKVLRTMQPEKRTYFSSQMPMTEAAIDTGFTRDVYVSLGEPLEGRAWAVRVYYKPFVDWIWGGCVLMALGGLCAVLDRRVRVRAKSTATTALQGA
jgi:cytochrome c-type biogenesis protein CcmF